ncbi:ABC transporter ATP-binding protein [Actinomycetospora sp. NBRC 106378]|uniref:ABC transporter ATP-binding protein n=1 Tax=Actinomycetospora sp. NBRC 106378 TaxID=3032208 RepID=UPI0024A5DA63|nr:ABC transporter ATP-binding protein [Actinomycetospora sp. NBRC 106378]GLZ54221.1 multidrug ABC transporter ATP-binding protein [Actinomycetospora sp. NBRC 106378]
MSTQTQLTPTGTGRPAAAAVEVTDLVKRYPKAKVNAVDGISFAVAPGEVFGLLGPNGAGKTTTIGVLTTRVRKTSGYAAVTGIDVAGDPVGARSVIGVVPQRPNLDRSLDAKGNLVWHAAYHGVPRARRGPLADELLERMGLTDKAHTNPDELSGGQAQRLIIARGLMHGPRVLFLDEPSTGLDPQARLFVHDRVAELAANGVTIVLTTHDMDEAAKLSDRVGIVDHGELLKLDTPANLVAGLSGSATVDLDVTGLDPEHLRGRLSAVRGTAGAEVLAIPDDGPARLRIRVDGEAGAALPGLLEEVTTAGGHVSDVGLGEPTLEDVFIDLTGRGLR